MSDNVAMDMETGVLVDGTDGIEAEPGTDPVLGDERVVRVDELRFPDIDQAIVKMREYRQTHVAWAEHFDTCGFCEQHPPEYVDARDDQLAIVKDYDSVLELLERMRNGD